MTKRQFTPNLNLVSKRLYLREISPDDLDFLSELHQDPEVMKYIGPLRNREELNSRIFLIRQAYKDVPEFGIWLVCLRNSSEPIGWFNLNDLDGNPEIEIGYRLSRKFWGKGYATEMSVKLLEYGFVELGLNQIVAVAIAQNKASIRVLEKAGFRYWRTGWYYSSWVNFYMITLNRWYKYQKGS